MEQRFKFQTDICKVIHIANEISEAYGYPCVTDIACFNALMLFSNQPMFRRLIAAGVSPDEITNVSSDILKEYRLKSMNQKQYHYLVIGQFKKSYKLSNQLFDIFDVAMNIAMEFYEKDFFSCNELLAAFSESLPEIYEEFLKKFPIYPVPNNLLLKEKNQKAMLQIPADLYGCITVLNNHFSPEDKVCEFRGRDRETMELINVLAKDVKRNAVLVGEPGVGKTALVELLTWMIVTDNCPKKFKDFTVLSLDINSIIAGTMYRGTAENRFKSLNTFLESADNCILFIDEIHTMLGAGACRDGDLDLANAMKPILARGKVRVIGATTEAEYANYFSRDGALKRRFEKIIVKEPKVNEVYLMIKNKIERLSNAHNVSITEEIVEKIIFYASAFNKETKNPDRTLDLIDKAMASVELKGRNKVQIDDVIDIFDSNYKRFEKTPVEIKTRLAFHEVNPKYWTI